MLHFVTENKNKFLKATEELKKFNLEVNQVQLNILEPQSADSKFIAEFKANQAFEQTQKPVIITDTNWSIPSLKGFPGPYMKYMGEWFESEDFLNLMEDKTDRKIIFEDILVFKDHNQRKVFVVTQTGELLFEPKGEGHPVDRIVSFRKDKKSIAECTQLGISSFDENVATSTLIWKQFAQWYNNTTL